MAISITVPTDLWEEDLEAVITTWLVNDGARVKAGDLIAEIMVQKVQHEIRAPADGTITIERKADEIVAKGDEIGRLE